MFQATFLGQNGWRFAVDKTNILVDAILGPDFGRGPLGARYPSYPPKLIDFARFPPLDAVFVTHEHEDHFNIPTLHRLDRGIPVYLPSRSSSAARTMIREMGFQVRSIEPGTPIRIGGLTFTGFTPDHLNQVLGEEWDTTAFMVSERGGTGRFFSEVDVDITEEMRSAFQSSPCLLFNDGLLTFHARTPGRNKLADGVIPLPGVTVAMQEGRITELEMTQPFLSTPPRAEWPARPSFPFFAASAKYAPVSGKAQLRPGEFAEIVAEMPALAQSVYGGPYFKRLYSLSARAIGRRRPTFAIFLRTDARGGRRVLEYDPLSCAFHLADKSRMPGDYLAGVECWAPDFLKIIRGDMEPRVLLFGGSRAWSHPFCHPMMIFWEVLCPYFHPLRQPERCLNSYRAQAAAQPADALRIPARSGK